MEVTGVFNLGAFDSLVEEGSWIQIEFFFKRKEKWGQLGDFSKMGVTCLHDDDKESIREGISDGAEERR